MATLTLYWPALRNGFVDYDDDSYVTANAQVQSGLTAENFKWAFTRSVAGNWHPITMLSHMLVCQICGLRPFGHHLLNVLLHAANAALVFILLWRLTGATSRSAIVAALFAMHPLRVESVAWIAERKDVLSGFFGLLALIAYGAYVRRFNVQRSQWKIFYGLALLLFALGLMSKPMLVTWPLVMLLLDFWPLRRIPDCGLSISNFKAIAFEKVPFLMLAAVASVITYVLQQHGAVVATLRTLPLDARVANALVSYCRYLQKTFWPENLAVFYPWPRGWPLALISMAGILVVGISVLAVALRKKRPYVFTGWFWFFVTLMPVIGLVQAGQQAMADRYTYLPSVGISILLVWGLAESFQRGVPQWNWLRTTTAAAAVVACCILTLRQISFWRDGEVLFRHSLEVTENNYVARDNLGVALMEKHDASGALSELEECVRLQPDFARGHVNLGDALAAMGRSDDAIAEYRRAIELEPGNVGARNNLGVALFNHGRTQEAGVEFQEVTRLQPENFGARNNLGGVLYMLGRTNEAIAQFREALRLKPDYVDGHANLAKLLTATGQSAEAIHEFHIYFQAGRQDAEAHFYLGQALLSELRTNDAMVEFQEALRLKPGYTEARAWLQSVQKK